MLPLDEIELAVFPFVEQAQKGQWQAVSFGELARAIGRGNQAVFEAVGGLCRRGLLERRKWSKRTGQLLVPGVDLTDDEFYHHGDFQLRVTSSGRRYFEELEQKEQQEKDAAVRDADGTLVFISCGQWSEEEKDLGNEVVQLVEHMTGCRAYFAENQSSVEGLKENIFRSLDRAAGFIGIMHHRGRVSRPDGEHIRGSVWVEQEIAIAAFLTQIQEREAFPAAVYTQRDIRREGVREQLLLHEVEFDTAYEVLADLERRIKDGRFHPSRGTIGVDLRPALGCRKLSPPPDSHDYELQVFIRNVGTEAAPNYEAEIRFPRVLVTRALGGRIVGETETQTHTIYRVQEPFPIPAGAQPVVLPILDFRLEPGPSGAAALDQEAEVTVSAPGMKGPRKDKKTIQDLISA